MITNLRSSFSLIFLGLTTFLASCGGGSNTPALAAPNLADIDGSSSLTIGTLIEPIVFTNGGGAVAADGCSVTSGIGDPASLPQGLSLSVSTQGSCQITGTPTTQTPSTDYVISATNSTGADNASITIVIDPASAPSFTNADDQIYVAGVAIEALVFGNGGGNVQADGCTILSGLGDPLALPQGLSLSVSAQGSCQITGTPMMVASQFRYGIIGTNSVGSSIAGVLITITPPPAPILIDFVSVRLSKNLEIIPIVFDNQGGNVQADGCAVASVQGVFTLPQGLSVSVSDGNSSCQITGTPTTFRAQSNYTIEASNLGGTDTATIMIDVINPIAPDLANIAEDQVFGLRAPISPIVFANAGSNVQADGCTVSSGMGDPFTLPRGLVVNAISQGTCQITGTPTQGTPLTVYEITATNPAGISTAVVPIHILDIAAPDLADLTEEQSYRVGKQITPITFVNMGGPVQNNGCTIHSNNRMNPNVLPRGLSLAVVDGTCQLSGTPALAIEKATYIIRAINAADIGDATISIEVILESPMIADLTDEQTYKTSTQITAIPFVNTGGPVRTNGNGCTVTSNSGSDPDTLPAGLILAVVDGTCQISGTPESEKERDTYVIQATNAAGSDTASISIAVTLLEPPMLGRISRQTYKTGTQITPISFVNAGGPVQTDGCTVSSGQGEGSNQTLPRGLSLAVVEGTCQISGTPIVASERGTYIIQAENTAGPDTEGISIEVVLQAPMFVALADQTYTAGTQITSISFVNMGGSVQTDGGGCTVTSNSGSDPNTLPAGLILAVVDGTCQISGTPASMSERDTYVIQATNSAGVGSVSISIEVLP